MAAFFIPYQKQETALTLQQQKNEKRSLKQLHPTCKRAEK